MHPDGGVAARALRIGLRDSHALGELLDLHMELARRLLVLSRLLPQLHTVLLALRLELLSERAAHLVHHLGRLICERAAAPVLVRRLRRAVEQQRLVGEPVLREVQAEQRTGCEQQLLLVGRPRTLDVIAQEGECADGSAPVLVQDRHAQRRARRAARQARSRVVGDHGAAA